MSLKTEIIPTVIPKRSLFTRFLLYFLPSQVKIFLYSKEEKYAGFISEVRLKRFFGYEFITRIDTYQPETRECLFD